MDLSNRKHAAVRRGQPEGTSTAGSSARRARPATSPVAPGIRPAARASHRPATRSSGRLLKLAVSVLSLLVFGWLLVAPGTAQGQSSSATTTTPNIRIELPWLDADGNGRNDFMGQSIRVSFTSSPVILRLLNAEGQEITEAQARADGGAQAITLKGCSGQSWANLTVQTEPGGSRTVAIGDGPQLVNVPVGQTESCNYEVGFPRLPGVSLYPGSTIYYSADTEQVPGKKGATVFGSYSVPPSANSRPSSTSPNPGAPLATADSFFTPGVEISLEDDDGNAANAHGRSGATVRVTFYSDSIATNPPSGCSNNVPASVTIQDDGTASMAAADAPELVDVPVGYGGGCRYSAKFAGVSGYGISGGGITTVYATQRTAEVHFFKVVPRITTTYFTPRVEITVPDGFAGTSFDVQFTPVPRSAFECNTPEFIAAHRAAQAANPDPDHPGASTVSRPEGSSSFTATYTVPASGNIARGTGPRLVNQPNAFRGGGDPLGENDQPELAPPCAYTVIWPEVDGLDLSVINGRSTSGSTGLPDPEDPALAGLSEQEIRNRAPNTVNPAEVSAAVDRVTATYIDSVLNIVTIGDENRRTAELPPLSGVKTYFTPSVSLSAPALGSVVGGSFTQSDDLNPNNDYSDFEIWVDIWVADPQLESECGLPEGQPVPSNVRVDGSIIEVTFRVAADGTVSGSAPRLVDSANSRYTEQPLFSGTFVPASCLYKYTVAEQFYNELVVKMIDGSPWDSPGAPGTRAWDDEIFPLGYFSGSDNSISATYQIYRPEYIPTKSDVARSYFTPDINITVPQVNYDGDDVKDYTGTTFDVRFVPVPFSSFLCNTFEAVSAHLIAAHADPNTPVPRNTFTNPNRVPPHSVTYTVQDDGTVTATGDPLELVNEPNGYTGGGDGSNPNGGTGPGTPLDGCVYQVLWPTNEGAIETSPDLTRPVLGGILNPDLGKITVPDPCLSGLTLDLESYYTNELSAVHSTGLIYSGTEDLIDSDIRNLDTDDNPNRQHRSGAAGEVQGRFLQDQRADLCNLEVVLPPTYFTPNIEITLPPAVARNYAGQTFTVRFLAERGSALECNPRDDALAYVAEVEAATETARATATSEGLTDDPTQDRDAFDIRVGELLDEYHRTTPARFYYHEAVYTVQADGSVTGTAPELLNQPAAWGPEPNPNFNPDRPVSVINPRLQLVPPCVYDVLWPIVSLSGNSYLRPAYEIPQELTQEESPNEFGVGPLTQEEAFERSAFRSQGFTDIGQLHPATTKVDSVRSTDHPSTARAIYFESSDDTAPPVPEFTRPEATRFTPNVAITVPQENDDDGNNIYAGTSFEVKFSPASGSAFYCANGAPEYYAAVEAALAANPELTHEELPAKPARPDHDLSFSATYTVQTGGDVTPDDQASIDNLLVDQPQVYKSGTGPLELVEPCEYHVLWPSVPAGLSLDAIDGQRVTESTGLYTAVRALTKAQLIAKGNLIEAVVELLLADGLTDNEVDAIVEGLLEGMTETAVSNLISGGLSDLEMDALRVARYEDTDTVVGFTDSEIRALVNNTLPPAFVSNAEKDASAVYVFDPEESFVSTTFTPRVNIIVPQIDENNDGMNDFAGRSFDVTFHPVQSIGSNPDRSSSAVDACFPDGYYFVKSTAVGGDPDAIASQKYSDTYTVQDDGSVISADPIVLPDWVYIIVGSEHPLYTGARVEGGPFEAVRTRCVYKVEWADDDGTGQATRLVLLDRNAQGAPIEWLDGDTTLGAVYFQRAPGVEGGPDIPAYVPLEEDLVSSYFTPNVAIQVPSPGSDYAGATFEVEFWPLSLSAAECSRGLTATYTVQSDGMVTGTGPRLVDQPATYLGGGGIPNPDFDPAYTPEGIVWDKTPDDSYSAATSFPENQRLILDPGAPPIRLADPCTYRLVWPTYVTVPGDSGATLEVDTINGARATGTTSLYAAIRAMTNAELVALSGLRSSVITLLMEDGLTGREINAITEGLLGDMTDQEVEDLLDKGLWGIELDALRAAVIATRAAAPLALTAAEIRALVDNTVPEAFVSAASADAAAAYTVAPEVLVATYFTPRVNIVVPQKDTNNDGVNDFAGVDFNLEIRPRSYARSGSSFNFNPTIADNPLEQTPLDFIGSSYWCNNPDGRPELTAGDDRPELADIPAYTATYIVQNDGTVMLTASSPDPFRLVHEPAAYEIEGGQVIGRAPACTYSVEWPRTPGSDKLNLVELDPADTNGDGDPEPIHAVFSTYLDRDTTVAAVYFEPGTQPPPYIPHADDVPVDCVPSVRTGIDRDCVNEIVPRPAVIASMFTPTVNIEVPAHDANGDSRNDYADTLLDVQFWPVAGSSRGCYPAGYAAPSRIPPYSATYRVGSNGNVSPSSTVRLVNQPAAFIGDRLGPAAPKCVYSVFVGLPANSNLELDTVAGARATQFASLSQSIRDMNRAQLIALSGLSGAVVDELLMDGLSDNEIKAIVEGLLKEMTLAEVRTLLQGGLSDAEIKTRSDAVIEATRTETGNAAAVPPGLSEDKIRELAPNTVSPAIVSETRTASFVFARDDSVTSYFEPDVNIVVPDVDANGDGVNDFSGIEFTLEFWPSGDRVPAGNEDHRGCFPEGYSYNPTPINPPSAPYTAIYTVDDDGNVVSDNPPNLVHQPADAYVGARTGRVAAVCTYLVVVPFERDGGALSLDAVNGARATEFTGLESLSAADIKALRPDLTDAEIMTLRTALRSGDLDDSELRDMLRDILSRPSRRNALGGLQSDFPTASFIRSKAPNTLVPAVVSNGKGATFTYRNVLVATNFTPAINIVVPQKDANEDNINDFIGTSFEVEFRPVWGSTAGCSSSYDSGDAPAIAGTYTVQNDGNVTPGRSFTLVDQPRAYEGRGANSRPVDRCVYEVFWPTSSGELSRSNVDGASFVTYLSATSEASAVYYETGTRPPYWVAYVPTQQEMDLVATYFTPEVNIEVPQVNDEDNNNIYAGTTFEVDFWPKRATRNTQGAAFECNSYDFVAAYRAEINRVYEEAYSTLDTDVRPAVPDPNDDDDIRQRLRNPMIQATIRNIVQEYFADPTPNDGVWDQRIYEIDIQTATFTVQNDGSVTSEDVPRLVNQPASYQGDGEGSLAPRCVYEVSASTGEAALWLHSINGVRPAASVTAQVSADTAQADLPTFVFVEDGFTPQIGFQAPDMDVDTDSSNDFAGTVLFVDFVPTGVSPQACPTRERRAYTIGDDGTALPGYFPSGTPISQGGSPEPTVKSAGLVTLPGYVWGSNTPCSYKVEIAESGWPYVGYSIAPLYLESLQRNSVDANIIDAIDTDLTATFAAPFSPVARSFAPSADVLVPKVDADGNGINDFAGATLTITYRRSGDTLGMCTATADETYTVPSSPSESTAELTGPAASLVMSTDGARYDDIVTSLTDDDLANDKTLCQYRISTSVTGDLSVRPRGSDYPTSPADAPTFADYRSISVAETTTYQVDMGTILDDDGMPIGKVFACDADASGTNAEPSQVPFASVSCGVDFPPTFLDGQAVNIGTDSVVVIRRPDVHVELSLVSLKAVTVFLSVPSSAGLSGQRVDISVLEVPREPEDCLSPRVVGGENSCFPRNYQPCLFGHTRTAMIRDDGNAPGVTMMVVDVEGGESSGCEYVVQWPDIGNLNTPAEVHLAAGGSVASGSYTLP